MRNHRLTSIFLLALKTPQSHPRLRYHSKFQYRILHLLRRSWVLNPIATTFQSHLNYLTRTWSNSHKRDWYSIWCSARGPQPFCVRVSSTNAFCYTATWQTTYNHLLYWASTPSILVGSSMSHSDSLSLSWKITYWCFEEANRLVLYIFLIWIQSDQNTGILLSWPNTESCKPFSRIVQDWNIVPLNSIWKDLTKIIY